VDSKWVTFVNAGKADEPVNYRDLQHLLSTLTPAQLEQLRAVHSMLASALVELGEELLCRAGL
jgi:predicted transcriptional regulator